MSTPGERLAAEQRWAALENLRLSKRPSERNWLVDVTLVQIADREALTAALVEALRVRMNDTG